MTQNIREDAKVDGLGGLFMYKEMFRGGYIEDRGLARLKVLLESPSEKVGDLEDRVKVAFIKLNAKNREDLTQFVYRGLYRLALDSVSHWRIYYCSGKVLSRSDVEDVAEIVTLQAIRDIKKFKPNAPFSSWVYSVSRYRLIDFLRSKRHEAINFSNLGIDNLEIDFRDFTYAVAQNSGNHMEEIETKEELEKLNEILSGKLSREDRELLLLTYSTGSYAETGRRMGISEDAVRMKSKRLMEKIRLIFEGKISITRKFKLWNEYDIKLLREMVNRDFGLREIAARLERTEKGVGCKVYNLSREGSRIFKSRKLKRILSEYYKLQENIKRNMVSGGF